MPDPGLVYQIQNDAPEGFKYLRQLGTVWFFHLDSAPASLEVFSAVCRLRCSSPAALPDGGPEAAQAKDRQTDGHFTVEFNNTLDILG